MKRMPYQRRGFSILFALGFCIVIFLLIAGLRTFSSYRILTSVREWNSLKAKSLAESGLSLLLAELAQDFSFETHAVNPDLTWGAPKFFRMSNLEGPVNLDNSGGQFSGSLTGFGGEFQVRCGTIPYADDRTTLNVDESRAFLLVESVGIFGATQRRITAVINRRFPSRECLLYDGDVLSVVYGEPTNPGGDYNAFVGGNLYGHLGVEIGSILHTKFVPNSQEGTRQRFFDIERITSGKGGIFLASPVKLTPRGGSEIELPASPGWANRNWDALTYADPLRKTKGLYPNEFLDTAPEIPLPARAVFCDKTNPTVMNPAFLPFEYYRTLTSGTVGRQGSFLNSAGNTEIVLFLDFGDLVSPAQVTVPGSAVICSEKSIVVHGNPDRNVTIVSMKDIYLQGDFNQKGNGMGAEKFGYPQNYQQNACRYDVQNHDYRSPVPADRYQLARLIAGDRIIFDYRDLRKCFANEIFPHLRYCLAREMASDSTDPAYEKFLKVSGSESLEKTITVPVHSPADPSGAGGEMTPEEARLQKDQARQDALVIAKQKVLGTVKEYLEDRCGLNYFDFEESFKNQITSDFSSEHEVRVTLRLHADFMNEMTKKVWEGLNDTGLLNAFEDLVESYEMIHSRFGRDMEDDYLYFPEMTTNGMFISFGKRNQTFYPGPDYQKHHSECGTVLPPLSFVHRMYGSECWFRMNESAGESLAYHPPIRKKVYDRSLPTRWSNDAAGKILDIPTFSILTWKESSGNRP